VVIGVSPKQIYPQTDLQTTEHLNVMNGLGQAPWGFEFFFRPGLQAPLLKTWKGDRMNVAEAQRAFHHRACCNSKARFGEYTEEMENTEAVA
jgi:fructose-bisphosphate aldolase class I